MKMQYYLQLTQPNGKKSYWVGYYRSKKIAKKQAEYFRRNGWKVRMTTYPTKWNKKRKKR